MRDSEKPKRWKDRRQSIKHKWLVPFIFPEWLCERLSYFLGQWALLDICGHIGRFGVLVSIIVGVCVYVMEVDERRMQAENERQQAVDQRKAKHYQAWQVINSAQGKPAGGGRKDALEDLNKDNVSLVGVDISKAQLPELNLENAVLWGANLTGANLHEANLAGATLWRANLAEAVLLSANLTGANLLDANLTRATLWRANLTNIKGWQKIKSIELANIYDVNNPPDGFIEWAKEHGAVSIENPFEWKKLTSEKEQEKTQQE